MDKIKNIDELKLRMANDSSFVERLTKDPVNTINNETDISRDPVIFKTVLYFVGFALIFSLVISAIIILSGPIELTDATGKTFSQQREVDQFFVMIGSAAIGALAGLLVPRPD